MPLARSGARLPCSRRRPRFWDDRHTAVIAILGGLGAAAAWSVSTVCSSRSSRMIDPRAVVAWMMLVGFAMAAPPALAHGVPAALHGDLLVWYLIAGAGNVGGLIIAYHAMRIGRVSLIAPIVSTDGAVAASIAVLAGEALVPGAAGALALTVVGVAFAATPATDLTAQGAAHDPGAGARHLIAVGLAVLAAVLFGLGLYAAGHAGTLLPVSWIALSPRLLGVAVLTLPMAIGGRLRLTPAAAPLVIASGVLEVLGS